MSAADPSHKWQLKQEQKIVDLILNPRLVVDDFVCLHQAVIDDIGIVALPHYMCSSPFGESKLVEVLPDWHLSQVDIYAVYPSHRGATPKLRSFLDYFSTVFRKMLK